MSQGTGQASSGLEAGPWTACACAGCLVQTPCGSAAWTVSASNDTASSSTQVRTSLCESVVSGDAEQQKLSLCRDAALASLVPSTELSLDGTVQGKNGPGVARAPKRVGSCSAQKLLSGVARAPKRVGSCSAQKLRAGVARAPKRVGFCSTPKLHVREKIAEGVVPFQQALCTDCRRARYAAVVLDTASQLTRHNVWALQLLPAPVQLPVCNGGYHKVAPILRSELMPFGLSCKLAFLCSDFLSLLPPIGERDTAGPCCNYCKLSSHESCAQHPMRRTKEPGSRRTIAMTRTECSKSAAKQCAAPVWRCSRERVLPGHPSRRSCRKCFRRAPLQHNASCVGPLCPQERARPFLGQPLLQSRSCVGRYAVRARSTVYPQGTTCEALRRSRQWHLWRSALKFLPALHVRGRRIMRRRCKGTCRSRLGPSASCSLASARHGLTPVTRRQHVRCARCAQCLCSSGSCAMRTSARKALATRCAGQCTQQRGVTCSGRPGSRASLAPLRAVEASRGYFRPKCRDKVIVRVQRSSSATDCPARASLACSLPWQKSTLRNRMRIRGGAPGIAGSGTTVPPAQCFFCDIICVEQHELNFADQCLCRCRTCRRRVCSRCAEPELGNFYCPWCIENRVAALEAARSIARVRACATRHCSCLEDRDYAYAVQLAQLYASNRARADMVKRAENWPVSLHPMQVRTGGAPRAAAASPGATALPDLLKAVLLSVLGDSKRVAQLLQEPWVKEWHGWQDVADAKSDSAIVQLAQRLLRLAETHATVQVPSNQERLNTLRRQGWYFCQGHAHGANNCLLDSLLVALAAAEVLPRSLQNDVQCRARACAACRAEFVQGPDERLRPQHRDWQGHSEANDHAYLELDRHGPPAATFLYKYITGRPWPAALAVDVVVYTRFDNADLNPESWPLRLGDAMQPASAVVSLYNHMDDRGNGYHFDALISLPHTLPASSSVCQAVCSNATGAAQVAQPDARAPRADAGRGVDGLPLLPAVAGEAAVGSCLPRARVSAKKSAGGHCVQWAPSPAEMLSALDAFLVQRGAEGMRANHRDAARAVAAWNQQDELAALLKTLLQAGLKYSDLSRVGARKVAAEFRGFVWTYHSGPGRKLGADAADMVARGKGVPPRCTEVLPNCEVTSAWKKDAAQVKRRGKRTCRSASVSTAVTKKKRSDAQEDRRSQEEGASGKQSLRKRRQPQLKRALQKRSSSAEAVAVPKRRRYSVKQPLRADEPPSAEACARGLDEDHFILRTRPVAATNDSRARADAALSLVADQFLEYPTLPKAAQSRARSRAAAQIPDVHCAFATCGWTGESEAELQQHVLAAHAACLQPAAGALIYKGEDAGDRQDVPLHGQRLWDAYRAALDVACQRNAPLACATLDRRCLRQAAQALEEAPPETRICMLCARRRPFVSGANSQIWFSKALEEDDSGRSCFLGLTAKSTAAVFGRETYVERYVGNRAGPRHEGMLRDLHDWTCVLDFPTGPVAAICCPEPKSAKLAAANSMRVRAAGSPSVHRVGNKPARESSPRRHLPTTWSCITRRVSCTNSK